MTQVGDASGCVWGFRLESWRRCLAQADKRDTERSQIAEQRDQMLQAAPSRSRRLASYFPAQKSLQLGRWSATKHKPAGPAGGLVFPKSLCGEMLDAPGGKYPTDVDEIICDDAEPDPTFHAGVSFVATPRQSVSPLHHAD